MRYSVAALAAHVDGQVAALDTAPETDLKPSLRSIAGVTVQELNQTELQARRENIRKYYEDRRTLELLLEEAGVTHLGIVPSEFFYSLAKTAGLIRFRPNGDRVAVSHDVISRPREHAENHLKSQPFFGLVVGFFLGALALLSVSLYMGTSVLMTVFASIAGGIILGLIFGLLVHTHCFVEEDRLRTRVLRRTTSRFIKRMCRGDVALKLWPDGIEPEEGLRIPIRLPEAPEDAQQNLLRAAKAGFSMQTIVEPGAIALPKDLESILAGSFQYEWDAGEQAEKQRSEQRKLRRQEAWSEFWESIALDPIIEVRHGTASAVIVQYGDFPIEQQVVEDAFRAQPLFL